jgi:ATP-dependent exoDNAse (exonuclease V) alpha subunit
MRQLIGDQPVAFEQIKNFINTGTGMHLLQGAAGTGKTFTLSEIVAYALMKKIKPIVTSPTHKSLRVLKKLVDQNVTYSTIHSALGLKEFIDQHGVLSFKADPGAGYPAEDYDLIIVDEVSMLDNVLFDELCQLMARGKKILFVGDSYQIPPINTIHSKPFLKSIQKEYQIGVSTLNEIIRQAKDNPSILYSYNIRADIHKPVQIFNPEEVKNEVGGVFVVPKTNLKPFTEEVLPLFKSTAYQSDIDFIKLIGWRNRTIDAYNKIIREYVFGENLPKIIKGDRLIFDAPIMEDRRVIISTNDEAEVISTKIEEDKLSDIYILKYYNTRIRVFSKDVFNEYMVKIMHEDSEKDFEKILELQKALAKSYPVGSFKSKSAWVDFYEFYNHWAKVKYSYCVTCHKAQSSTYHSAYVLAWDIMMNQNILERNRVYYTACTRPSTNLYIEY